MKFDIHIDCSPAEARAFLGFPDVTPMQQALMAEVEARMKAAMQAMDAETLMKTWLPLGFAGFEEMQKTFWRQFGGGARDGDDRSAGQSGGKKA